jgi:hypothetical protein
MVVRKRKILVLLWFVAAFDLLLGACLTYYFIHNRPDQPQPELDRICAYQEHTRIVYLTPAEKRLMDFWRGALVAVVLLAIALIFLLKGDEMRIGVVRGKKKNSGEQPRQGGPLPR